MDSLLLLQLSTMLALATEMFCHHGDTELRTVDMALQRAGHSAKPQANTGFILNMECFHERWDDSQARTYVHNRGDEEQSVQKFDGSNL